MRRAFAAMMVAVGLAASGTVARAATIVVLDSQPGDWIGAGSHWTFTEADGNFRAIRDRERVRVLFDSPTFRQWDFGFLPPVGLPLAPGVYQRTAAFPLNDPAQPDLRISGANRGCNSATGVFTVLELALTPRGEVARLAVDFEQHCDDAVPALFGSLRFDSTLPIPSADSDGDGRVDPIDDCPFVPDAGQENADGDAEGDVCDPFPDARDDLGACLADYDAASILLGDTDHDGEAGSTDLCPDTPPGVAVDDAGCSHAQFCARIDPNDRHGRDACLHADWRNDEPGMRSRERDCTIERAAEGRRCVAKDD